MSAGLWPSRWPWQQAAPDTAAHWLEPARGLLEPPIRAQLLGASGFCAEGHALALSHGAPGKAGRARPFFPRLRDNIGVLHAAHRYIARQESLGRHVSPAGEWLLDNIHLVVAQTREVHDGLPRRNFRGLPVLKEGPLAGLPRVYAIAWAYVSHADSAFEPALLVEFLLAYQSVRPLTQGELWALPTTLRVVLVENLRRLAEQVAAEEAAREAAHGLCDQLAHGEPPADALFEQVAARGVLRPFALQVMQRLHADSDTGTFKGGQGREAVRGALAAALPEPALAQTQQQAEQAAHNQSVGNAIRSLQLLGSADWRGLIAQASPLMQVLLAWAPFAVERDDTQDSTLHAIERLARRSERSESDVAISLLALAATPLPSDSTGSPPPSHALGYWLHGAGCATFQRQLGLRVAWGSARPDGHRTGMLPTLLLTLAVGTAALSAWLLLHPGAPPPLGHGWAWAALVALCGLLALLPASEVVMAVLYRMIHESVPPTHLPRLALAQGIPPEARVLVVIPAMLTQGGMLQTLVERLERHHLANRELHAQFALLTDFADADTEHSPNDAALLAQALACMETLEARHHGHTRSGLEPGAAPTAAQARPRRFLLLHRARTWCPTEHRWMGWERKRGKLEQLVALLAGSAAPSPFVDLGVASRPAANTPWLITLDSDTDLPPGALRELVGLAAHPLNLPRVDLQKRRVVAGHGILQPRIVTAWPVDAQGHSTATGFHRLFAGAVGSDPYNAVASEVYQDLFGEGSFTGKGLMHVAAVHAVLAARMPDGQVLSHDLLEGCLARCGSVSDVALIEPAPTHADVAASRTHRWTRGDWQLLPLLFGPAGQGLHALDRWKVLDNLRRSLVPPCGLALMLIALAGGPVSPWAVLALMLAAFGLGPVLGAVAGLAPSRDDLALVHFLREAGAELARSLLATVWQVALWWRQSALLLDAQGKALWRTHVSHRHLLQWTTAATAEAQAARGVWPLLKRHATVVAGAMAVTAAMLLARRAGTPGPAPGLALALGLSWIGTPLWIAWASRPVRPPRPLNNADRAWLQTVAHNTWAWFAQHVGEASHHLPPDNVQTMPRTMIAQRTSPTNIGLYLLSMCCARAFGWITPEELASRLGATLDTLDKLPRERGHLMNWIDTGSLATLAPAYVSTVDSGNLCGHLLAVAQACDDTATHLPSPAPDGLEATLRQLARRCRAWAEGADFSFLYDTRRRLLHIGWRVDEQQLDSGHYDLLASEARLASLWAIAKGDVPATHWSALGRPFQATLHDVGLRSWSGSMFEYLMPTLVLEEPQGTALDCAARMAVQEQRDFGVLHGLPWGVSECAYAAADRTLAYQYAPQGVPRLALRRTPPDERVVAPYASALAAMLSPHAAVANLRRLQGLQARGPWGFIEAMDYTASRQIDSGDGSARVVLVNTWMAHHQGMTLVAITNVLLNGQPRRWAMADPRLAAVASLLQERVPREVARLQDPVAGLARLAMARQVQRSSREVVPGAQALQRTQMLSNGHYSVTVRPNGAGFSRLGMIDLHRWRDDALQDAYGSFLYLRRHPGETPISLTRHPAGDPAASYSAQFHTDRICLEATWPHLRSRITVWVSPEDDVELRRVELWNTSSQPMSLELLSAFEATLSDARADETHPAFANLFIRADWDPHDQALHFARGARREQEAPMFAVHFLAQADGNLLDVRANADRSRWAGRLHRPWEVLAEFDDGPTPAGNCPTGLDPVAALAMRVNLPPHGTTQFTLATAAARDRDTLDALVDRYRQATGLERSSQLSATLATLRLRDMRLSAEDLVAVQTLTTLLVQLHTRPAPITPVSDRRLLWRFGLSGDRPLIVITVSAVPGLRLVGTLVQGLHRWAWGGVAVDLVVINSEPRSYLQPLQRDLMALRERHAQESSSEAPNRVSGFSVQQATDLSADEQATLAGLARVALHADGRPLAQHMADLVVWHELARQRRDTLPHVALCSPRPATEMALPPVGEFDADDGAWTCHVSASRPTPRPWVNVLANPALGTLVSEAGASCTWAGNSRLHQLTPWNNDRLGDLDGEHFWLQDLATLDVWNLGPGPGSAPVPYRVRHQPGLSSLQHRQEQLSTHVTFSVDPVHAVKRIHVQLHNHGSHARHLRVVGLIDWLMGSVRIDRQSVTTSVGYATEPEAAATPHGLGAPNMPSGLRTVVPTDPAANDATRPAAARMLLATQCDNHDQFGGHTAFVTLGRDDGLAIDLTDWTCDRRELFDFRGHAVLPEQFGQRCGHGLDPCAALGARVRLAPGAVAGLVFTLGHGHTAAEARTLARQASDVSPHLAADQACTQLDQLLGAVQVATPDPLFDALVNHWLLYQATACRLWGRAGFYQAGGAYGFRDQLQDAMALVITAPALLREQVLRAAARQFVEGDVQHWWHPHSGAGVRTRFSDDLLWLPHAAWHYVQGTGDTAIWHCSVPFIDGPPVPEGSEDLYSVPGQPERAEDRQGSLYEHCARSLDHSLKIGPHGLPLMGGGDWNDGMNRVGPEGRGESVWLAWFLCSLVPPFTALAREQGDNERAERWQSAADGWRAALASDAPTGAWDGAWFKRAFFDDGSALGSSANAECRIDLIAQCWAVLSHAAPPERQQQAMASAQALLADNDAGLLRLLTPPLAHAHPDAGYIQAYPPGVRENGGQYNHAGVWAVMAWAQLGRADLAWQTWRWLSPAHRANHPVQGPVYGLEPYAVAADVYSQPPYTGQGGWSWYTGSAAGMYRAAVGTLCGLQLEGSEGPGARLRFMPCLPPDWPGLTLTLRHHGRLLRFSLETGAQPAGTAWADDPASAELPPGQWLNLDQPDLPLHHRVLLPEQQVR
ncbi:MAG: carbohydrate-binding protein [Burkholderiales bacterium PBB6]|nr:MAG: carbohydrate-binding protein [Burkholderiales bacterium PBB6]